MPPPRGTQACMAHNKLKQGVRDKHICCNVQRNGNITLLVSNINAEFSVGP